MNDFVLNFDEIKGPEPLAAGAYIAEIASAEAAVSKAGNPMIKLRWQVVADEHGDEEFANKAVFDNLVFVNPETARSDYPLQRIKECLEAVGWEQQSGSVSVDPDSLVGRACLLSVIISQSEEINEETGEPYPPSNNVRKYSALSEEQLEMITG